MKIFMKHRFFPHRQLREGQERFIKTVAETVKKKRTAIVHAPTGLGKTAAVLTPVMEYALAHDKCVFFLTSRHTQHKIVIETLREIEKKAGERIKTGDLIGKKWMCSQEGVHALYSGEFYEYCRKLRENGQCPYYTKTRSPKLTADAKNVIHALSSYPHHVEEIISHSQNEELCSYEVALEMAKKANIIIADYHYLFNPDIRRSFLSKTGKELEDCILIVDEGHNMPGRLRELMSAKLSTFIMERAVKEARKFRYKETLGYLAHIQNCLNALAERSTGKEMLLTKKEFIDLIEKEKDYDDLIADFALVAESIRESQKNSYVGAVGFFLERWQGQDEGFARILSSDQQRMLLQYRCMDPALVSKPVMKEAHSTIIMSGTLHPAEMYKNLLGLEEEDVAEEYENPFPKKNRMNIIVPKTTTKFTKRDESQYKAIAEEVAALTDAIHGNVIVFFPSYDLRDKIYRYFATKGSKTCILEHTQLKKDEKKELLEKFKSYEKTGAVLLAAIGGSFSEGIDLPGELLNGVIVVGLPLTKPDLYTEQLIAYYDKKFGTGRGWEYGYVMPAMNKCFQSAGRCIRSESDRGVMVFLDERYAWQNYLKYFPKEGYIVNKQPLSLIRDFFRKA